MHGHAHAVTWASRITLLSSDLALRRLIFSQQFLRGLASLCEPPLATSNQNCFLEHAIVDAQIPDAQTPQRAEDRELGPSGGREERDSWSV